MSTESCRSFLWTFCFPDGRGKGGTYLPCSFSVWRVMVLAALTSGCLGLWGKAKRMSEMLADVWRSQTTTGIIYLLASPSARATNPSLFKPLSFYSLLLSAFLIFALNQLQSLVKQEGQVWRMWPLPFVYFVSSFCEVAMSPKKGCFKEYLKFENKGNPKQLLVLPWPRQST